MLAGMNICDFDTDGFNELKACEIISGSGTEFIWKYRITDTIPPQTTCSLAGDLESGIFVSNVTVSLSAVDNGSGVLYTKYKLDAGEWTTYAEPFLVTMDGNHTLLFYSVDRSGNAEEEKICTFAIQHHPMLALTIKGGNGVSVIIENKGLLPLNKVPWQISLSGGILLKGAMKEGLIPQLLPGQKKTIISSVLGIGKTLITVTVDDTQSTAHAFVFLIFVFGVQ